MNLTEDFNNVLESLYGKDKVSLANQLMRYNKLFSSFNNYFLTKDVYLFSVPGRTELGGNHTDHNNGKVLAASVNLDSIAVISKNDEEKVTLYSEGYEKPFVINLIELDKVDSEEGSTNALIRGIAARFVKLGYNIGGFSGVITSDVLPGSGLSSSASIEVLIGLIFNSLYNDEQIGNEKLAMIGQWAENNYFGKPCGLMDQMACAVGGIIGIDFKEPGEPIIEQVKFDFDTQDYKLLIVDTGANHEDLTDEYAAIPFEMIEVAKLLHKEVCRDFSYTDYLNNLKQIRTKIGDRALLRVFHFLNENERVSKQINALNQNDFVEFLGLVKSSGNSSYKWLQNIYSTKSVNEQSMSLALALTEKFIEEKGIGACRVHGGGFAGTIQVFVPNVLVDEYKNYIENICGLGTVMALSIRVQGAVCLNSFSS